LYDQTKTTETKRIRSNCDRRTADRRRTISESGFRSTAAESDEENQPAVKIITMAKKRKRPPVPTFSKPERQAIAARQLWQCEADGCMRPFWMDSGSRIRIEYRIALDDGGPHHPDNARAVCHGCQDMVDFRNQLAGRPGSCDCGGCIDAAESELASALMRASQDGRLADVAALMSNGAHPNVGLLFGCANGRSEVVDLAVRRGADAFEDGLVLATIGGYERVVGRMLAAGAVMQKDIALSYACRRGFRSIVDLLISNGANNWNNALCQSCAGGQERLVERMVSNGATDFCGGFMAACYSNNLRVIQAMVDRMAAAGKSADNYQLVFAGRSSDLLFDLLTSTDVDRSALLKFPKINKALRRLAAFVGETRDVLRRFGMLPELRNIVADYCGGG
jgi:hypothetical protein